MNFWRRGTTFFLLGSLLGFMVPIANAQDNYPSKPIKLIVPWTPGGTVDMTARHLADRLSARLPCNRPINIAASS